jgi:hypothetical protein
MSIFHPRPVAKIRSGCYNVKGLLFEFKEKPSPV